MANLAIDVMWDDSPVDVTAEANFIWSIANKLRGSYMPDKYGDVIIPMTIIRRFECALLDDEVKRKDVIDTFKQNPNYPEKALFRKSGFQFYNTSDYTLQELCNDADHVAANFRAYIAGFSANVQDILKELEMEQHINKMDKDGCLYSVVKAFSELDLSPRTFDSIKMGYIFENLIGRFYQNVDAGQFYTGRDIIKLLVSLLISEGCDDIFDARKIITVCDQACGTGGMLSTAYSYLKHYNPSADVRLFGQEMMGQSYAVGLAEMLIKGQNAENFRHADTLKEDCFEGTKMRFLIENPPFGTPWSGKDAKAGQEDAVNAEYAKRFHGRWGAGLPSGGDSQLLFLQSAVAKLDDQQGRAAIIENGSPLFTGGTASGESQVRRWLLENDLIEAIIQMPTELFYNTGISTYVWILSKNKRKERMGKIQLIDASGICHKLRKPLGNKKNEFSPEDRKKITELYANFIENECSKIYDNTEFIYKEYAVMQPLQRSYSITEDSIQAMLRQGTLKNLWDEIKVAQLEELGTAITGKEQKTLDNFYKNKPVYDAILDALQSSVSNQKWLSPDEFMPVITEILSDVADIKTIQKIADGLSVMDKEAVIQKDKKGNILFDKSTKDTEIVKVEEDIDSYMEREVLPHIPDAVAFWEENLEAKNPVIRTGAEIPFTRYFYKYQQPTPSEELEVKFNEIDISVSERVAKLFGVKEMPEMKDSRFQWIGMIPANWKCERGKYILKYMQKPIKLDDGVITCFRDGEVTLRSKRREDGFTMADKEIGYQGIDVGDLVVHGMDGFAGAIGISDSRGKASPVLNVLDTKQNKKYIMYFLRSMAYNNVFLALATGIRVRSCDLRWNKLAELYYPIPPLDEQNRIAAFLDIKCSEIDALTMDIQAEIDTLEEYKRSVIMEKVTKGLEPNVEMKNSGIEWVGEIPHDWNKIKIKYATIEIKKGISPDYTEAEKTKIINQATFSKGFFDIENIRFANDDFNKSKGKVQRNDVLLATTGGGVLGKTYYFDEEGEFLASTDVAYLRVDTSKLLAKFLYYCLTINYAMFNDLMANGSTNQTHFDMPSLFNMFLPLPNIKTQNIIIDYLDKKCLEIEDIITKKKQQLEILNQYKKSMIYEYVTGKKEVV